MRTRLLVLGFVLALPASAHADQVLSRQSSWNPGHTRIFTHVDIKRDDGSVHTVRVPGGTVDGIAMVQFHVKQTTAGGGMEITPLVPYVRTESQNGTQLRWTSGCVFVTPDASGTSHLNGDLEFQIIADVLNHWQNQTSSCSYLTFQLGDRIDKEVGFDRINLIKFRDSSWCGPDNDCHPPSAAALTTLFFIDNPGSSDDGHILDGDIEINAVNFAVSANGVSNGSGPQSDLANALTHEVGHIIGLDHNCWDGMGPMLLDHQGDVAPPCTPAQNLSQQVLDATMYAYQDPGETKKATVEQDDIDGVCGIYPIAADPGTCSPVARPGCCSVAGSRPRTPFGAGVVFALAALVFARRRRR